MDPEELEKFQQLSDKFTVDLPGPLISDRLPISTLIQEYAQADDQYVAKTMNLAHTHEAYRAVKGDGQCGWRSAVFSYFEKLLLLGDLSIVETEDLRMRSFDQSMAMIGLDTSLLEDMFTHTWAVFDAIKAAIQGRNLNPAIVLEFLNDVTRSDCIVYHFKTCTSTYLALHADHYEPFLEMPVDEYRVKRIDPHLQEIDQIGLQILCDAVINPAGFALEVLYLDRSSGDEVTPHSFSQQTQGLPMITLLYRPGHYDIIYRSTSHMQVYLANSIGCPQFLAGSATNPNGLSDLHNQIFGADTGGYERFGADSFLSSPSSQSQFQYHQQQYYQPSHNHCVSDLNQQYMTTPTYPQPYHNPMPVSPSIQQSYSQPYLPMSPPPQAFPQAQFRHHSMTSSIPVRDQTSLLPLNSLQMRVQPKDPIRMTKESESLRGRHYSVPLDESSSK